MIVIKYGGSLMDDKTAEKKILKNIKNLAEKDCVVVVHGGGKEITAALKKSRIKTKFVNGLRYTDAKAIKIVEKVLEKIQARIAKKLKNAVAVKKVVSAARVETLGYVGKFVSADVSAIKSMLDKNRTAVISPVGKSKNGQSLNLNADEVAAGIAIQLKARKLIFFTDVPGVLDKNKKTIPVIGISRINNLINAGVISGGMGPKVKGCAKAVRKGVGRVDIVNVNMKGTKIL